MRGMLILVGAGGMLALSGVPIPESWSVMSGASHVVQASLAGLSIPVVSKAAAAAESASLLLLASGFFAAAVLVRRRR